MKICDCGSGNNFLNMTSKAQSTKEEIEIQVIFKF